MTDRHWIPISFSDAATPQALEAAINACHRVHIFTVETLNNYFIDHAEMYPYYNFRRELNLFLRDEMPFTHGYELLQAAQRYSLVRAAEKTFPYFNENKKIKRNKFVPVEPIHWDAYNEIQIEARKVWRKYLALDSLITTTYGSIFLEGDWVEVLTEQAAEQGAVFEMTPFLMHSVTVFFSGEETRLRFNLHHVDTKFGKSAKREMKVEYA